MYYKKFSNLVPLRFIAYYSYNWYLWHPMFVLVVSSYIGVSVWGFLAYMVISFAVAMFFTIIIEDPFLKWREVVLPRLFKRETRLFNPEQSNPIIPLNDKKII